LSFGNDSHQNNGQQFKGVHPQQQNHQQSNNQSKKMDNIDLFAELDDLQKKPENPFDAFNNQPQPTVAMNNINQKGDLLNSVTPFDHM